LAGCKCALVRPALLRHWKLPKASSLPTNRAPTNQTQCPLADSRPSSRPPARWGRPKWPHLATRELQKSSQVARHVGRHICCASGPRRVCTEAAAKWHNWPELVSVGPNNLGPKEGRKLKELLQINEALSAEAAGERQLLFWPAQFEGNYSREKASGTAGAASLPPAGSGATWAPIFWPNANRTINNQIRWAVLGTVCGGLLAARWLACGAHTLQSHTRRPDTVCGPTHQESRRTPMVQMRTKSPHKWAPEAPKCRLGAAR